MTSGFPIDAVHFFTELEHNNERAWWLANQDRWRRVVREPMQALCDALAGEFGEPKVFRPYRDVRFSADKTPYKTHQGAVVHISPGVGLYVQLSGAGLLTGTGWWRPEPGQLDAYRAAVLDDDTGEALVAIVAALEEGGVEVHGDELRTAPRGVDPAHPRIRLLRYRTVLATADHGDPDWLATPEVVDRVRADWRSFAALNRWLATSLVPREDVSPR
ncbi:MAG: DUF2461 domain-containing protein [Propionicimonas sp.]|uniref:DUF2461 domain-containing protein n=1 Tax=Propionicimonas sp. TaxID=1955623 RepID=UPI003D0F35A0